MFFLVYAASVVALCIVQLVMGANIVVTGTLLFISLHVYLPIRRSTWYPSDILYFITILYTATFAILLKTFLGQTLEQNLVAPMETSFYLLVGNLSVTIGYFLAPSLWRTDDPSQEIDSLNDISLLKRVAVPCYLVGALLQVLFSAFRPIIIEGTDQTTGGLGFLGSFFFLTTFGIIAQTTIALRRDHNAYDSFLLLGMLASSLGLSIAGNIKVSFLSNIASVLVTYLFNRERNMHLRGIVILSVVGVLAQGYLSPIIHLMRPEKASLSIGDRFVKGMELLEKSGYNPFVLTRLAEDLAAGMQLESDISFNYLYPNNDGLERFCLIQPVDQIVRNLSLRGIEGIETLSDIPSTALPSFAVEKLGAASPDFIGWYYGFLTRGVVGRPVVGIVGSSIALGGLVGALIAPMIVLFLVFGVVDRVSGSLRKSPAGLLWASTLLDLPEWTISAIVSFMLREFLIILTFLWAVRLYRQMKDK